MEDQRLGASATDPLHQTGAADQVSGDLGDRSLSHFPGHDFAAPDIDCQVEEEPDAPHAGGQVGEDPDPDLIGPGSPQARNRTRFLWRSCSSSTMRLPMGVEHAVEAALRTDVEAPIRQDGNDLPRRQRRELGLIAAAGSADDPRP